MKKIVSYHNMLKYQFCKYMILQKKKKESFFTLTESGVSEADLEKSRMMAKERAKNTVVNPLKAAVGGTKITTEKKSLTSLLSDINSEKKIASEYYTNEEMAQFKKKRKRVRKVRQIVSL